MIEDRLDARIPVEINVRVWMVISRQKLFDPERAGGMSRAEQHDVSVATGNQLHPPEDECSHENLTQLGVDLHERQQPFALDLDQFAGLAHTHSKHSAAAAQHAGFTRELARAKGGHKVLVSTRRPDDLQVTRLDDEEPRVFRPGFDEDFAILNWSDVTVRGRALDLFRLQCRKHPLGSRIYSRQSDWRNCIGHARLLSPCLKMRFYHP